MTLRRTFNLAITLSLLVVLLIGCGSPAPQAPAQPGGPTGAAAANGPASAATPEKINVEVGPNEAQIILLEPEDGDVTRSPFYLRVGLANFKIPLNNVSIHIAIDASVPGRWHHP
jgi:hypothetical protein